MYTILIVDDEKLALEGIYYSVGASGFPFHWIMEAESAEEALEIICANQPDILLTDIKMGKKNGLELIREAKEIHPNLVAGIICGYQDFAFAREAVSLGVCGYLLKPVKNDEVKDLLSKATQIVRKQRESTLLSKDNDLFRKTLQEHMLQENMGAFISSSGREGRKVISSFFAEACTWYQMYIVRLSLSDMEKSQNGQKKDILIFGMQNIIQECIDQEQNMQGIVTGSIEHENILYVLLASSRKNQSTAEKEMQNNAAAMKSNIDRAYGIHVAMSGSLLHNSLTADMYQEAVLALDLRLCIPNAAKETVLFYHTYQNIQSDVDVDYFSILKKLIVSGSLSKAAELVREMVLGFDEKERLGLRRMYTGIVNTISVAGFKSGVSLLPFLGSESISGSVLNVFETLKDVTENLLVILHNCFDTESSFNDGTKNLMLRVKEYIDNSYADSELGTNELAKEFCISLGYLSACYKKEHGITISKYIINRRIEHAEKLLLETTLSVGKIAESCGFNNLSYFMRLFKNIHGVTPSQYRHVKV